MKLHPEHWTPRTYLWIAIFLVAINLLGPRGLIHFMVIHQEAERLSAELDATQSEKEKAQTAISNFKRSDDYRDALIRERLGYLRKDELLLKFIKADAPHD